MQNKIMKEQVKEIIAELKSNGNEHNRQGMKRFGIEVEKAFGVNVKTMRKLAKAIGRNQELSLALWESGYHEARIVAFLIGEPEKVTQKQMDSWAAEFNSWDICDGCCNNLFDKSKYAYRKIEEWSSSEKEFVRRAGFSLLAVMSVHDKKADDKIFLKYFPLIEKYSFDDRNYVKKAVNWALRQIGKRGMMLNEKAVEVCLRLKKSELRAARWIGSDAYRELTNPQTILRTKQKEKNRMKKVR